MDIKTIIVTLAATGVLGAVGSAIIAAISKAVKKEKLGALVWPSATIAGKWFTIFTRKKLGAKLSDGLEQGGVVSILFVIRGWIDRFEIAMLSDNKKVQNDK